MKLSLALITTIGLAMAAPSSDAPQASEVAEVTKTGEGFIVDLSALAAFTSESEGGNLEARGSCPHLQTCVGRRCVMLVCEPISQYTTTCITFKYGSC